MTENQVIMFESLKVSRKKMKWTKWTIWTLQNLTWRISAKSGIGIVGGRGESIDGAVTTNDEPSMNEGTTNGTRVN